MAVQPHNHTGTNRGNTTRSPVPVELYVPEFCGTLCNVRDNHLVNVALAVLTFTST